MVMVWGYALAACESEISAGTALYYWFAGDVVRYCLLYNALFLITGALVVKFACLIVQNPDEDCQNKALRKVLREVDHLMPIKSTLEQSMPPFQDTSLEISDILKSFPTWNPVHPPSKLISTSNFFISPSENTLFTWDVDAIMPNLEQDSCKEHEDCLAQLEEDSQAEMSA